MEWKYSLHHHQQQELTAQDLQRGAPIPDRYTPPSSPEPQPVQPASFLTINAAYGGNEEYVAPPSAEAQRVSPAAFNPFATFGSTSDRYNLPSSDVTQMAPPPLPTSTVPQLEEDEFQQFFAPPPPPPQQPYAAAFTSPQVAQYNPPQLPQFTQLPPVASPVFSSQQTELELQGDEFSDITQGHGLIEPFAAMPTAPEQKFSPDRRKLCCVEGCKSQARAFNRCKRHGGSKRCSHPGCTKSVQSRGLCIRHGGGSRCTEQDCTRASQSHGKCKMHGGGRPCIVPDCEKKAHLKRLCRKHGGGAKCTMPGCDKWAQRQGMCMTHAKLVKADSGGPPGDSGRRRKSPTPAAANPTLTPPPAFLNPDMLM